MNFPGRAKALREAARVDLDWSLTHGRFAWLLPLRDPQAFLPELGRLSLAGSDEAFRTAMRRLIVEELYEWAGNLRNALERGESNSLPLIAMGMAQASSLLLGLARRHLYGTGARVLAESLSLADPPEGHECLCRLVLLGRLADPGEVGAACDALWQGVSRWAPVQGLAFVEERRIPF